jgi:hypothetical protein
VLNIGPARGQQIRLEKLVQRLAHYASQAYSYSDPHKLLAARLVLPPTVLLADGDQETIRALLLWFKNEFFRWTDSPLCTSCGGKADKHLGIYMAYSLLSCTFSVPLLFVASLFSVFLLYLLVIICLLHTRTPAASFCAEISYIRLLQACVSQLKQS